MSLTFDDVVRIVSDLPGIEVGTSYGTPALRVGKKFMCRMREDGETMVLKPIEDIELQFLMDTQPASSTRRPTTRAGRPSSSTSRASTKPSSGS